VQTTLEADGLPCEIDLVDNREDFVASLEDGGYDIILADFVLPSIDGFSALSIAQEKWPDIPFIIISAYIGEENAVECLKAGATDYVGKQQLPKLGPAIRRAQTEIEERRKRTDAEEALLKNEEHYRILFDLSPSGILLEDIDGRILDANTAICNSIGYSHEELVGNNVRILVPPESTPDVAEHISLILSRGTLEHEVKNVRKDGTLCHMELREKRVMLPGGKDGILVVANDVTLRKRAEEALRESEERYRAISELTSDYVYFAIVTKEGQIVTQWITDAYKRITGYEWDEIQARGGWISVIYPEDLPVAKVVINKVLSNELGIFEYRIVTKHGETCWLRDYVRPQWNSEEHRVTSILGAVENITEHKKAEKELLESEARLGEAQRIAHVGSWDWDLLSNTSILSDEFCRIFDLESKTGLCYESFLNCVHPDDREIVRQTVEQSVQDRKTFSYTYRILQPDGTERIIQAKAESRVDEEDRPVRLVGTVQDITEHKRAEEALRESEARFRTIFEMAGAGIALATPEGKFLHVNPFLCRLLGYSDDELKKLTVSDITHPDDLEETRLAVSKTMDRHHDSIALEKRYVRKNGNTVWAHTMAGWIFDVDEKPIYRVAVILDITERKHADDSLRKLLSAVEQTEEVIFMTDTDGAITFVNPAFEKVYGFSKDEVVGKTPRILKSGMLPMEYYTHFWETILSGKNVHGKHVNKAKDGRLVTAEASVSPIYSSEGTLTGFIAVQEDITDHENAEAERKNLEAQLIQAQKIESLGTLAGGIAHDFNNILGIILGHSTLLERSANDPAQQSRSTQAINKAVQRGSNLVGQILTFARKTDVAFEPVNLNEIITELARMLEDTFPKTIDISLELEKHIPLIEVDRSQLHQTVLNLCVNARDAMPEGGTLSINTGNVRITELRRILPEAVGDRFVRVSVSDTGIGMDEATRQRIFEPFFSTKPQDKGTGLGLAVVFGIMKSHHGYIEVESKIGRGSSFHSYFPVAPRSTEMNQTQDDHMFEVEGGNETLLLVEDEEMLRELVRNILQAKGYNVLTASDGEGAIRLYAERKNEIAIVISDIGLPKQSGGDLLSRLKEINSAVNVILASGYIEPEEKHRLLESGAIKFIQKPYVPQQILKQVREILDGV
jgi:PAS domain S-box-containing protein